jgi:putative transposase
MPWGLKRYYGTGGLHFITWSCYRRQPLLATSERKDLLLAVLDLMRERYRFAVIGYVVMPEHVHLLVSEPEIANPSTVVQTVKLGFTGRSGLQGQVWQRRFYDFNVWSQRKEIEKLRYMHRNPVIRGLVGEPDQWPWSSYRSYADGEWAGANQRLALAGRQDSGERVQRNMKHQKTLAPPLTRVPHFSRPLREVGLLTLAHKTLQG